MKENLDAIDRHILYELDWDARQSETDLAKKIGRSREAVRYRIRNLENNKIIDGYILWINFGKLGYRIYNTYLKTRKELPDWLKRKDLAWLALTNGGWGMGFGILAKTSRGFFETKNRLFSDFGQIFQKTSGEAIDMHIYSKTFLYPSPKERRLLMGSAEETAIDGTDRKIISELYKNSRIKLVELAKSLGISPDIARIRMKKLERKGVIVGYKALLNYKKLGIEFYRSFLYFDSFSKEDEKKLHEIAMREPGIVYVSTSISPWDVEVDIAAEDPEEFNRILQKLKEKLPNLRNLETVLLYDNYMFPAKNMSEL